jgi:soluble lytic murein transglycosylase-like protein
MAKLRLLVFAAIFATATPAAAQVDRWSEHIAEASARFGIPEAWIRRVMQAESGGRTLLGGRPIVSHAGAQGLMQVMPGTWRELRDEHGLGADPHQPRDNILAGTAYLRAMYDRFGYPGLFAAYNAGPARYAEHLSSGRRLPSETVDYVARVAGGVAGDAPPAAAPVRAAAGAERPMLFAIRNEPPPPQSGPLPPPPAPSSLFVMLGRPGAR